MNRAEKRQLRKQFSRKGIGFTRQPSSKRVSGVTSNQANRRSLKRLSSELQGLLNKLPPEALDEGSDSPAAVPGEEEDSD